MIGDEDRARDLDHGTDLDLFVKGDPGAAELVFRGFELGFGPAQLLEGGEEGEHQADLAEGARAENGSKLQPELLGLVEAEADATPSEERIGLGVLEQFREEFVTSDVEGADDDAVGMSRFGHLAVVGRLILFITQLGPTQVKKLGAVEADPLGTERNDAVEFLDEFDVRRKGDFAAVGGAGILMTEGLEIGEHRPFVLDQRLVFRDRRGRRIDDDKPVVTVHQDDVTGREILRHLVEGDDGRDAQGAGHDRRVRGGAAQLRGETPDPGAIEPDRVGGGQIVGEKDARARLGGAHSVITLVTRAAPEIAEEALGDVFDIDGPLPQVGVGDLPERVDVAFRNRIISPID